MNKNVSFDDIDWNDEEKEGFDVSQFINKIKANWLFILLAALTGLLFAYIYLYASSPRYITSAKVLIKEDDPLKSGSSKNGIDMLQTLGLSTGSSNVDNELEIIKSFTIMHQAVMELGLYVSLSKQENKLRSREYYGSNSPYIIHPAITDEKQYGQLATDTSAVHRFQVRNNRVLITNSETGQEYTSPLGGIVKLPGLDLQVSRNAAVEQWNQSDEAFITFVNPEKLTDNYLGVVNAEIPNKQVSVINMSLEGATPAKSGDLLNQIIKIYINNGVADRNAISDSTISFIDARLAGVTTDLKTLEVEIQKFKQKNEIVDISEQAKAMLENSGDFYKTATEQEVQVNVVTALIDFMQQTSRDPRLVPASLTVDNASLSPVIEQYNKLLLERQRSLLSMTEDNPVVTNIDQQLSELRNNLLSGLKNIRNAAQSGLNTVQRKNGAIDAQLKSVPAKEREFLEYSRQQAIKQELYLFLLQKREEAALSKSSTLSNARIIDVPRTDPVPVKPKRKMIMALGLLFGLAFPFAWMWIRELLNNRIQRKKDIEHLTKVPIVGEIGHFKDEHGSEFIVSEQNGRHPVVEQFRILRSNLNYSLVNAGKVILVTSSNPGEGKTFVSLNLAATFALSGKKTIIVGLDLRKPKLNKVLKMERRKGLTHYLVGQATLEEIIHPIAGVTDLYTIVNGTIPPNPAELLMSEKTKELIKTLQQQYDYVIIDTAPVIVTDAAILSNYTSLTLYISRVGITYKESVAGLDKLQQNGRLGKLNLVVNDIDFEKEKGYYSYYGYNTPYSYGYYEEKEPKKSWHSFLSK
ncbi:MAG: polysaccharide biosynthesis tyrosine autokinase [Niabella sp.]